MVETAIEINNIVKTYGTKKDTVKALNDVSFEVKRGELFGLVGPDGAGKTSLIRILTTLLLADSGKASVEGYDVVKDYKKIRNTVGYMPGKFSLYQDLTVEENLNFFATIFNTTVAENMDLIRDIYVQIEPFKTRRAGKLSGGMKQKLALCCALIHKPTVLFLDEPTTGVDPVSRKEFWQMLKSLQNQNITVLVSTPYMDEAKLCDKIALMQNGNILDINSPENIIRSFNKKLFAIKSDNSMYPLLLKLRSLPITDSCFAFGDYHHVTFKDNSVDVERIRQELFVNGFKDGIEIKNIQPTVEDCFMAFLKD